MNTSKVVVLGSYVAMHLFRAKRHNVFLICRSGKNQYLLLVKAQNNYKRFSRYNAVGNTFRAGMFIGFLLRA